MQNPEKITRLVLKLNAAFSSLVGLDLLFFNSTWMDWMGISNDIILPILGIGLALFGAFVFWIAFKKPMNLQVLRAIIFMDMGWVLGCVLIAATNLFGLTMLGNGLILISAVVVGTFAYFQNRGWKRMNVSASEI